MDSGIYQHLIDFAGCGATVPLTGFGSLLSKGVISDVQELGFIGAFTGGIKRQQVEYLQQYFLVI